MLVEIGREVAPIIAQMFVLRSAQRVGRGPRQTGAAGFAAVWRVIHIANHRPSAIENEIMQAARATYVGRFVRSSTEGDSEAASSVDTRTAVLVQKAMSAVRSDRTSFVIAHQLSIIHDADLILVLEFGRIVEQGTHASLLETSGAYAALYAAQFAAPVAEV